MLFQLIYFFIISFFCMAWGIPIVSLSKKENLTLQDVLLSFFVGLAAISVLASWIGLFTAVRFELLFLCSIPFLLLNVKRLKIVASFKLQSLVQRLSGTELFFIAICLLLF